MQVTRVVDAEVFRVLGPAVIVRGPKGLQMFSPGDVERRSVTIHKDGSLVELSDLREGDRLTATIVTEGTPKVLTEREVEAALAAVPVAAAPLPSPPASAPATAPFSEPPAASAPPARVPATSAARTETANGVARFLIPGAVLLAALIVVLLVRRAQRRLIAHRGERDLPRFARTLFSRTGARPPEQEGPFILDSTLSRSDRSILRSVDCTLSRMVDTDPYQCIA